MTLNVESFFCYTNYCIGGLPVKKRRIISVLTCVLVFLGLLLIKVGEWVPQNFGNISFEQILFHLIVPMVQIHRL